MAAGGGGGGVSEAERERRRGLALRKLARVIEGAGAGGGAGGSAAAARAAERRFLKQVARMTVEPAVSEAVRARLHVITYSSSEEEEEDDDEEEETRSGGTKGQGRAGGPAAPSQNEYKALPSGEPTDGSGRLATAVGALVRDFVRGGYPCALEPLYERAYWQSLGGEAAVGPGGQHRAGFLGLEKCRADLGKRGFCQVRLDSGVGAGASGNAARLLRLRRLLAELRGRGYPPAFLYMFDEALEVVRDLALFSAAALGCSPSDVELERSCFAWALNPRAGAQNFGLPHRDYSYSESIGPGGSPTVVCAWTPLVDTSPDNGCLYMVPRALDALWSQPGHPNHMRAAVRADGKELSSGTCHTMELNFNLAGAQPQLLRAGDAVLWNGNTVHWGGACDPDCAEPRQSLGVTFRRRTSPATAAQGGGGGGGPAWCAGGGIPIEELLGLSTEERLRLVLRSMLLYSQWYDLAGKLPAISRLVEDAAAR